MRNVLKGLLVALLAGCSSGAVSSAAPTSAPTIVPGASGSLPTLAPLPTEAPPSASASVSPTPEPTEAIGTLDVIPPGAAIEVTVAELNLRTQPSTSSRRVATLKKGDVLITLPYDGILWGFGPRKANGYVWYPVVRLQVEGPDGKLPPLPSRPILIGTEVVGGWIATHDGSKPYVTQLPPRCPETVDLRNVEAMLSAERLACFEGAIVVEGTFGCPGCGGTSTLMAEPLWLADPFESSYLSVNWREQLGPIALHFPPAGPARPKDGTIIRATTHVDDPASATCSMYWADLPKGDPGRVVPASTAALVCRERLVVDSYETLGVDPDFGG
ncbi:MAG TPA: hypothetical protein VFP56_12305 [Candidatus Limnocylindrales bacterium]|nr:hypothetical protein [Candidatus Limnocylindrales bacterium]